MVEFQIQWQGILAQCAEDWNFRGSQIMVLRELILFVYYVTDRISVKAYGITSKCQITMQHVWVS